MYPFRDADAFRRFFLVFSVISGFLIKNRKNGKTVLQIPNRPLHFCITRPLVKNAMIAINIMENSEVLPYEAAVFAAGQCGNRAWPG